MGTFHSTEERRRSAEVQFRILRSEYNRELKTLREKYAHMFFHVLTDYSKSAFR